MSPPPSPQPRAAAVPSPGLEIRGGSKACPDVQARHAVPPAVHPGARADVNFARWVLGLLPGAKTLPYSKKVHFVPNIRTMTPDSGYTLTSYRVKGFHPKGRIYVTDVTITDGGRPTVRQRHQVVLDGKAYRFSTCQSRVSGAATVYRGGLRAVPTSYSRCSWIESRCDSIRTHHDLSLLSRRAAGSWFPGVETNFSIASSPALARALAGAERGEDGAAEGAGAAAQCKDAIGRKRMRQGHLRFLQRYSAAPPVSGECACERSLARGAGVA